MNARIDDSRSHCSGDIRYHSTPITHLTFTALTLKTNLIMPRPDSKSNYAGSSQGSGTTNNASAARYADTHRPQDQDMTSNSSSSSYTQSAYGGQLARTAPRTERVLRYASTPDGGPPNGGLVPGFYRNIATGDLFHIGWPPLAKLSDRLPVPPPRTSGANSRPMKPGPPPPATTSPYERLLSYPDPRLQDEPHPLYESVSDSDSSSHRNSSPSSYHTAEENLSVALTTSRSKSPSGSRSGSLRESRPDSRYG